MRLPRHNSLARMSWKIILLVAVIFAQAGWLPGTIYRVHASPTLSVSPLTWNIIGLDSNSPTAGPYRFPVGARVCNSSGGATSVSVDFNWDDGKGLRWGDTTPPDLDPNIKSTGRFKNISHPIIYRERMPGCVF